MVLLGVFVGANISFFRGDAYIPYDSTDQFFPQTLFVVRSLLRGDAPWWNPLVFSGIPVLGDPQSMIFTPHTLIGLVAGGRFGQLLFDVTTLGCLLAGAGALLEYSRRTGGSQAAGLLGAVVFMLGGVATSRLQHVVQILSYATIPIILLALQHLCARPGAGRALLLVLAGLVMVLNPNQVVYLSIFALVPLAFLHMMRSPRPLAAAAYGAMAVILVVAASSPVFAAINETLGLSTREGMSVGDSAANSFPAFNLLSLFLPGLYGGLGTATAAWTPTDITQDYLYIGVIPGLALLWAALNFSRNSPSSRLAILLIPMFFVYSLGVNTPIYAWLTIYLPGVSAFRRPADAAFIVNFLCALTLAGTLFSVPRRRPTIIGFTLLVLILGALWWLAPLLHQYASTKGQLADLTHVVSSFARRLVVSALLLLASTILIYRLPRTLSVCTVAMIAWATFDLSSAGRVTRFVGSVDALADAKSYRDPSEVRTQEDPLAHLLATLDGTDPYVGGPRRMEAMGGAMGGNFPLLLGLANAQGYNPMQLASYAQLFNAQKLQEEAKHFTVLAPDYGSAPYRWLGLRYVLLSQYIVDHSAEFGQLGSEFMQVRNGFVKSGLTKLPAMGLHYEVWIIPGAQPKAVLTDPGVIDFSGLPSTDGRCSIRSYGNTQVAIECDTPRQARLVLNDPQAPGWRACVDGQPAALTPFANVLRSVVIPKGKSMTDFVYEPIPFWRSKSCNFKGES
jgi:hypothetical protein